MPLTPTGRWWCGANWKILALLLIVLAVLFVPILLLRHHLYAWMNIPPGVEHALDAKRAYLNWPFFLAARCCVSRLFSLRGASSCADFPCDRTRMEIHGSPSECAKSAFISLPMFALCLTFGAFDWLMSLNYHWFSTMFGVYIFAGRSGELDVAARPGHHRLATSWLSEGYRYRRALPHHGEMDAGLLHFLGLHRLRPVHADLVREHPGRDRILHYSKH